MFTFKPRFLVLLSLGMLGLTAVMTQLALMRELLCVFNGNEMVLGVILGNWLLLTGLGAWLGRKSGRLKEPLRRLVAAQILIALLPPAQIFAVRALRNAVFLPGAMPGVTETVISSFIVLLPFCLVSGYMLSLGCALLAGPEEGGAAIGRVYVADSLGSIIGGVLFSFVLIRMFDHFGLLCFPAVLNLALAGWQAWGFGNKWLAGMASLLAAGIMGLGLSARVDSFSTALEYPGQQVVFRGNSPYGKLVVTESAGQYNFFENGLPVFSSHDIEQAEEAIHYAMAQRPQAGRVLLVSGAVSGAAREILKYGVKEVTCLELDPLLIEVGRKFLPASLADARLRVVHTDGRLFINQTTQRFDVIIINVPAPSTSQLNRFFTAEFFAAAKRVLAPGGVVAFRLGQYENFVSPGLIRLLAASRATLEQSFRRVLALPVGRVSWLASDGELYADIAARLEGEGIPTSYVKKHYLEAMLTPDRLADVRQAALQPAPVNRDFKPVLYSYQLLRWMSQFGVKFSLLEGVLLALLAVYLLRLRAAPLAVFASGFAASSLEVILLLGFQILCGSLYYQLGVIVTTFMAGLAVGGALSTRWLPVARNLDDPEMQSVPASGARIEVTTGGGTGSHGQRIELKGQKQLDDEEGRGIGKEAAIPDFRFARKRLAQLACGIALFGALLPLILTGFTSVEMHMKSLALPQVSIALLTFVLALLVGAEFPVAAAVEYRDAAATAAKIYTADLAGACLGALLASTLLIPLLGVTAVCLITAGLNVLGAAAVWLAKRPT